MVNSLDLFFLPAIQVCQDVGYRPFLGCFFGLGKGTMRFFSVSVHSEKFVAFFD